MESRQVMNVSPGRMAGSVVVAILLGVLLPLIGIVQISLLAPVLMLCGIVGARLRAGAGRIPAALLYGVALGATAWLISVPVAVILLLAAVLPALAVSRGVAAKRPFFRQMNAGVAAYGIGLVAAMAAAYAFFGGGMVARFADVLRQEFARMPDTALRPFVDALNSALALNGIGQSYTVELYREQLSGVLDLMQQTYARLLPGALLSGAMLSGVLSVLWGNWTLARQGMATNESFIGMGRWFLPARVSLGVVGLWLLGGILTQTGYRGGDTVYTAAGQLAQAIFGLQALAAMDRRLLSTDVRLSRRKGLIVFAGVLALLFGSIGRLLGVVGFISAMLGSHGVIRLWLERRHNDHSDPDDPDL